MIKRFRTFRLWKLSNFAKELYKATLLLVPLEEFEHVCHKCGGPKAPLEGCHGDANNYFFRTTKERILQAVDWFFAEAERLFGVQCVTILRKRKWKGYLGGKISSRSQCLQYSGKNDVSLVMLKI